MSEGVCVCVCAVVVVSGYVGIYHMISNLFQHRNCDGTCLRFALHSTTLNNRSTTA